MMEEIQQLFVIWLVKFIACCALFLVTLRWIDRRWRQRPGRPTPQARQGLALGMSRRRARS